MLPSLLVAIVYGVVPIAAILIGWTVIRKDYAPHGAEHAQPGTNAHSDKEV